MSNRVIIYTNENTRKCMWMYKDKVYESKNPYEYNMMEELHTRLRRHKSPDLVEAIKYLLKCGL